MQRYRSHYIIKKKKLTRKSLEEITLIFFGKGLIMSMFKQPDIFDWLRKELFDVLLSHLSNDIIVTTQMTGNCMV